MQHHRFHYARDLQALDLLEQEIAAFKRHTTPSGKMGFDAESGSHDDLIFAIGIPLILGEWRFRFAETLDYSESIDAAAYRHHPVNPDGFGYLAESDGYEFGRR